MKVEISYSWGETEEPVVVPEDVDGFSYMLNLAIKEAKIELNEHVNEGTVSISSTDTTVELKYCDGEICYYTLV